MIELKPCPFCGGQANTSDVIGIRVECYDCEIHTCWYETEEQAVEIWNKRVGE